MTAITFDTLKYVNRLKDAKFTDEQAQAQAQALQESLGEALGQSTARILKETDSNTEKAILLLENKINQQFAQVQERIARLEMQLTLRMSAMFALAITIIGVFIKTFP